MTRDDILRMAREADPGFEADPDLGESLVGMEAIERFAALVAAATRADELEACISIAKQWDADHPTSNYGACIARRISARKG
jgi:hypothetical protein